MARSEIDVFMAENTTPIPKAKAVPKQLPRVDILEADTEEVKAMKRSQIAGRRQDECNKCIYDKQYGRDLSKCEKYPDKKNCIYLNKYVGKLNG